MTAKPVVPSTDPQPPAPSVHRRRAPRPTRRVPGGLVTRPAPAPISDPRVRGWVLPGRVDPRLCEMLQVFPGLLVERISGFDGQEVRRQAVDGLYTAARELARVGPDCTGMLAGLDKSDLRRRLKTDAIVGPEIVAADGRIMRHRFLLIDDLAHQGLLIALVTGTGMKADENLHGPAMDWLAEQVRAYTPALVWARHWKRWGRDPWAFASLAHAFKQLPHTLGRPAFGGDSDRRRLVDLDQNFERHLWQAGEEGREEAQELRRLAAGGSEEKTGRTMVNGRVPFATHVPAPAGLTTAVVRPGAFDGVDAQRGLRRTHEDPRGSAVRYMYIDEPACRPDPAFVISSRAPIGRAGQDDPVDQAALVLWFLAHYGTTHPDGGFWDARACSDYLAEHGFCTDGLRRRHPEQRSPSWTLGGTSRTQSRHRARKVCESILRHLEEYRSGVFSFGLIGDDKNRAVITDISPTGGIWLTEEDHRRIVAFEAGRAGPPRRGQRVFAGLPVTVDGGKAQLVASNRGPQRYFLADRHSPLRVGTRAAPLPPLPHSLLVRILVEGIARHDELPYIRPAEIPAHTELRQERDRLRRLVEEHRAQRDNTLAWMATQEPTEELAAHLTRDFNRNARALANAEQALARTERALDRATTVDPVGILDSDLVPLVPALADPWSSVARELLAGHLTLDIRSYTLQQPGRPTRTGLRLRGFLATTNGSASFQIPVRGQHLVTPRTDVDARVAAAVAGLRRGHPMRSVLGSDWARYCPLVREALGLAERQFRFATVDDTRLLRLCMAVIHPETHDRGPDPDAPRRGGPPLHPAELTAAARRLHEPVALLRRVLGVHTQPATKRRWLHDNSPVHADAYARVARTGTVGRTSLPSPAAAFGVIELGPFADEWTLGLDRATLAPCRTCGGTARIPLRLREATGSVCRTCRTDRAGVVWSSDYDRYRYTT